MSASGANWRQDVPVAGQKVIEADPQIVDAFKNIGYSLPAAVADLVDNSVDAAASTVLIRFLHTEDDLVSLVVVDDGRGMREKDIDRAMQFGGRRQYGDTDIGMYGMGLKSASLSQADNVTVLSKAAQSRPVGRRWTEEQAKAGWKCDVVAQDFVAAELQRSWRAGAGHQPSRHHHPVGPRQGLPEGNRTYPGLPPEVRTGDRESSRPPAAQVPGSRTADGRHRRREHRDRRDRRSDRGRRARPVQLPDVRRRGIPEEVPHQHPRYRRLDATAHIWPARAKSPGYKLGGGAVSRRQGFYFYRNDRLIQAGGWNNYRDDAEPHLSLARVAIDIPRSLESFFSIRFSKSGVDAPLSFVNAVQSATSDDGTSFAALHRPGHRRLPYEGQPYAQAGPACGVGAESRGAESRPGPLPGHPPGRRDRRSGGSAFRPDQFFEIDRDEPGPRAELDLQKSRPGRPRRIES